MLILILGVALWWAAHLFKRIAPERRAAMGSGARGMVAGLLVLSVILMIWGYRVADGAVFWGPHPALKGINNMLMLLSIYLFAADGMKTRMGASLRHPQLTGFALFAAAHLLPNGDMPSFVLFGGLLAWALVEIVVLNRTTPRPAPSLGPFPVRREAIAAVAAVVVMMVLGLIHGWIGPNPFGA